MGKTLTGILEIGAAIAVQFVPGLGTIEGIAIGISLAAAGLTTLLTKTQKPSLPEGARKEPTPVRISGYGRGRMQPAWTLFETASNGYAVDVYAFHDGLINRVLRIFIGDKRVAQIANSGFIVGLPDGSFGKNSDNVQVYVRLGQETETAYQEIINLVPEHWTANHRGDGVATGCMISKNVKTKNWQSIYGMGGPNQAYLSLSMERQIIYDWRDSSQVVTDPSTWKYTENAIVALAHYLLIRKDTSPIRVSASMTADQIAATKAAYWAQVQAVWNLKFAPTLAFWTAAANDADTLVPLNGVQTIMTVGAVIGDTHIVVDDANGLAVGMTIEIYVSGATSQTETRTVTGVSPSGTGYQVNFANGLGWNHPSESQVTWLSNPAAPATEARYRTAVTHLHSDQHKDVITNLLACSDGFLMTNPAGAYVVRSGRYYVPTISVGPYDILSYTLQEGVNQEDSVNTIKVTYISEPHGFNTVDTDDWVDVDRLDSDGKEISTTLQVQSPSFSQNRRLAKRAMGKQNAPYRGTVLISGRRKDVVGERYVDLDLTEAGITFFSGPVELSNGKRIMSTGAFQFDYTAADPNIDDWNPATEEGNPAPIGNRVALQPVAAPTITGVSTSFSSQAADGAAGTFLNVTIANPLGDRDDLTWFVRTRTDGFSDWGTREYDDPPTGDSIVLASEFVAANTTVDVEVSYQTGDGRVSDWSDLVTADTHTDQAVPDAAAVPALTAWTNSLNLTVPAILRATAYRWRLYKADGVTFIASYDTTGPTFSYANSQAVLDGIQRSYVVKVSGVNGAGEGTAALTGVLTNLAPAAVGSPAIAGGATTATGTCTAATDADLGGYIVFYSATSGFNPMTTGGVVTAGSPSVNIFGLAAGTYYGHIAAYDLWTGNPGFLNLSGELSFTITTGGGTSPSGGGASGGGYAAQAAADHR